MLDCVDILKSQSAAPAQDTRIVSIVSPPQVTHGNETTQEQRVRETCYA